MRKGCLLLIAAGQVWAADPLSLVLQKIVDEDASFWNISMSVAVSMSAEGSTAPTISAAAAGINDHKTGEKITIESKIPAGSAAKAYTAAAALRLVERGLLDLDKPVHHYLDPWNAAHNPPRKSLLEQWGGDETINTVTSRQLLQMRGGLQDYDDGSLFQWTVDNPDKDYLPEMFVETLNKTFLFSPGQGGSYSSTGFVMMGMVMSALNGAPTWDKLDQLAAVTPPGFAGFKHTMFMHEGKCSQYPDVVHQYVYQKHPYFSRGDTIQDEIAALKNHPLASGSEGFQPVCNPRNFPGWHGEQVNGWHGDLLGKGTVLQRFGTDSYSSCCNASAFIASAAWWGFDNGTCTVFSEIYDATQKKGAVLAQVDKQVFESDYTDLEQFSCLNGWTMGNIAIAPQDLVAFYHALGTGVLVNASSLATMTSWQPLTMGRSPPAGTPYGLGLLQQGVQFQLVRDAHKSDACNPPLCSCDSSVFDKKCILNTTGFSHPGLDWGSGVPSVAWLPELQLAFALGFNTFKGMNTSMGSTENSATGMYHYTTCRMLQAAIQHKIPGFPDFECQ